MIIIIIIYICIVIINEVCIITQQISELYNKLKYSKYRFDYFSLKSDDVNLFFELE